MNAAKELVELDWRTVIIGIVVIAAFIKVVVDFIHWLTKQFGIELKGDRIKKEEHDLLMRTISRMDKMEKTQNEANESVRAHFVSLTSAIDKLSTKVNEMAEKSDATERADLKDRIAQRYQKYSATCKWTQMEKESFLGLIEDYEAHGGKNSFVHSICEPECYKWTVTDANVEEAV